MYNVLRRVTLRNGLKPDLNRFLSRTIVHSSQLRPGIQAIKVPSWQYFNQIKSSCGKRMALISNQNIISRAFSTKEEEDDAKKRERDHKIGIEMLEDVMKLIRKGNFKKAQEVLYSIPNPDNYGKDVYYLTLYLLFMNDDFTTKPTEDIKKELGFCGLDEEKLRELAKNLNLPTSQQYVLEKNYMSGADTTLSVLLAFVAAFLLLIIFKSSNPTSFLNLSSQFEPESHITTRFSDVIGLGESLEEVQLLVKYLQDPTQFRRMGAKSPTGVLLTGPPGTGKTLLAKAVAGEAAVPFFFAAGSEFDEMFVGMGAKRVRELFQKARENAPCIVFIDELDAVGGRRDSFRGSNSRQTINQLLNEIGGFRGDEGVLIMGATNLKKVLDPALIRAGRFDLEIKTSLPNREAREQILRKHTQKTRLAEDVDITQLARRTVGLSGAELESLINVAAMKALAGGYLRIHNAHILEALDRIQMGSRNNRSHNKEVERLTLLHECGHALVSLLTPGAMPIDKITIIPRGDALGYMSSVPEEKDLYSQTKQQLLARLDVAMGGRAAEEVFYGEKKITTGASSDLQQASSIARGMVYEWGMNQVPRVRGEVSGQSVEQLPYYGEKLKRSNDEAIEQLLQESYKRAKKLIEDNKVLLLRLAEAVEEFETISGEDAKRLLKGEKMVDCYNVDILEKTEDDELDEEIYAARYPSVTTKELEKNPVSKIYVNEIDNATTIIAKKMLTLRQKEEEEIFEILLRENLRRNIEEEKKGNQN